MTKLTDKRHSKTTNFENLDIGEAFITSGCDEEYFHIKISDEACFCYYEDEERWEIEHFPYNSAVTPVDIEISILK